MTDKIHNLIIELNKKRKYRSNIKSCIGFDGYIDEILRAVISRESSSDYTPFQTIEEFSAYIKASSGKSSDIEVITQDLKLGGNAPIMANAMANLGIKTTCIGSFGTDEISDVFKVMSPECNIISIGEPAYTHAFEFRDGKLMFGKSNALNKINWEEIKRCVGLQNIIKFFEESHLIGIVNWSSLYHMNTILDGITREVLPEIPANELEKKYLFFDIADPSRRSREDMMDFFKKLREFGEKSKVILGLNEKEANIVCKNLDNSYYAANIKEIGKCIFDKMNIYLLNIHTLDNTVAVFKDGIMEVDGFYVDNPKISTGGGDNYNAGFCMGQLLQLSMEQSLIVANATASFYVSNGFSPKFDELIEFLDKITLT